MEKAALVIMEWESGEKWLPEDMEIELTELAKTSGAKVVDTIVCCREKPTPDYFVGSGKAEEIALRCRQNKINVVIFNDNLSPSQQRNLENLIQTKVIDRTQLILDIFAIHAKTQEGKVQVELAQLEYLLPRLTGKGVELSRLGGGIGTRGPGEQKLEIDRRRIRKRISRLKDDLTGLAKRRSALRQGRLEIAVPTVAIIGYTNAGKSTLLNALTKSQVIARDELFSTVDPITRRFILPSKQKVLFSDTVGFLHKLPHGLIEAFKSTLEEVNSADILLHVLDVNHPRFMEHNAAVSEVLKELKVEHKPVIHALNKIDKLESRILLNRYENYFENAVAISALNGENLDKLISKVQFMLSSRLQMVKVLIPHSRQELAHIIYEQGKIFQEEHSPDGVFFEAQLPEIVAKKLLTNLKTIC